MPLQELAIHGLMPKQEAFSTSLGNLEYLRRTAEQTGSASDQRRMAAAESFHTKLLVSTTILQGGWHKKEGSGGRRGSESSFMKTIFNSGPR